MPLPTLALPAALAAGAIFGLGLLVLVWRTVRSCGVDWTGLVVDDVTGKASGSKLGILGFIVTSLTITTRVCWNASPGEGVATMLFAVGGLLGFQQIASKGIGAVGKIFAPPGTVSTSRLDVEETKDGSTTKKATTTTESIVNPQPGGLDAPKA